MLGGQRRALRWRFKAGLCRRSPTKTSTLFIQCLIQMQWITKSLKCDLLFFEFPQLVLALSVIIFEIETVGSKVGVIAKMYVRDIDNGPHNYFHNHHCCQENTNLTKAPRTHLRVPLLSWRKNEGEYFALFLKPGAPPSDRQKVDGVVGTVLAEERLDFSIFGVGIFRFPA